MDEQIVYSERSKRPNLLKIIGVILIFDFFFCLFYGISVGMGDNIDAQMEMAVPFGITLSAISLFLGLLAYRRQSKVVTSIDVYEREVSFRAPYLPKKWKSVNPDSEMFEIVLPISDLRLASKKNSTVILLTSQDKRYVFVRMPEPDRLIKLINDKIDAR